MHNNLLIGFLCWPVVLMGQPFGRSIPFSSADGSSFSIDTCSQWVDAFSLPASASLPLTLEQSLKRLQEVSPALHVSDQLLRMARSERVSLRSFWYPKLSVLGAYVHLSQPVEVRQSLKPYAESAKDALQRWLFPGTPASSSTPLSYGSPSSVSTGPGAASTSTVSASQVASNSMLPGSAAASSASLLAPSLPSLMAPSVASFLDQLGTQTLSFPLLPTNLTGVQGQLIWPLFTGFKRIFATRIGHKMVNVAQLQWSETEAVLQARLVELYFGLCLAQRITEVRRLPLDGMEEHDRQAERMEQEGVLNKADRLLVRVACSEAKREWESAIHQLDVVQQALQVLLGLDGHVLVCPLSSLFMNDVLPPVSYFKQQAGVLNYPPKVSHPQ